MIHHHQSVTLALGVSVQLRSLPFPSRMAGAGGLRGLEVEGLRPLSSPLRMASTEVAGREREYWQQKQQEVVSCGKWGQGGEQ